MACHAIEPWTFSGLVGAFLDLALAYLLLCGSTLAFFASKFLGIFGLHLPCPCNGLFGDPNGGKCLQRLLVDCPNGKVSSVHMSVKSKFPFDSIWMNDKECHLNLKLVGDRDHNDGLLEVEGETSCSSRLEVRRSRNLAASDLTPKNEVVGFGLVNSPAVPNGRTDVKGKGTLNQKPRSGLRRRRSAAVEHGKFSSLSSCDPSQYVVPDVSHSSYSISGSGSEINEESSVHENSGGANSQKDGEAPTDIGLGGRTVHGFELNGPLGVSKAVEKDSSSVEEVAVNAQGELGIDRNVLNAIRVLEQALEEEHAASDALYLELEKERSAAATAADEAMAMILRLQKEKASIEMEARQYQRMIEEKSSYDAEEMDILKEILVRREREKHFLLKEVEAYRQLMLVGSEQVEDDAHNISEMSGQRPTSPFDLNEDPVLLLQRISNSIGKKQMVSNMSNSGDYEALSADTKKQCCTLAFGKEVPSRDWDDDADFLKLLDIQSKVSIEEHHPDVSGQGDDSNQEFQEKGIISVDENLSSPQKEDQRLVADSGLYELNSPQGLRLFEKTIILVDGEQGLSNNPKLSQGIALKSEKTSSENHIPYDGGNFEKHGKDADQGGEQHNSVFEKELSVHDVHVIDDESKLFKEGGGKESQILLTDSALDESRKCDPLVGMPRVRRIDPFCNHPSTSRVEIETDIPRSDSNMPRRLPPVGNSQGKPVLFELRRNSMSALDGERLKLETEVGWLREKLKIVQEGREKLNFSMEHREREKIQLQLLEDIAKQLREIRQLTEPGRAVRQASLPPPSSKVSSKKRCRSVSSGVHEST